jgi:hypothetical protein
MLNMLTTITQATYATPATLGGMAKRTSKMTELTGVRFSIELLKEIEDWRRAQPTIPAKGTAIRQLVEKGLAAWKAEAEKPKGRKS